MEMSNQEYQEYVAKKAAKSPIVKDVFFAFLIGGVICTLGQVVLQLFLSRGMSQDDASTATTIVLVGLSILLTGLNLYNKLARYGGAGTLVPVTGFANAVAAPAIDFKSEGLVTGMAVKMFTVAGPVIAFGIGASAIYGVVLLFLGLF